MKDAADLNKHQIFRWRLGVNIKTLLNNLHSNLPSCTEGQWADFVEVVYSLILDRPGWIKLHFILWTTNKKAQRVLLSFIIKYWSLNTNNTGFMISTTMSTMTTRIIIKMHRNVQTELLRTSEKWIRNIINESLMSYSWITVI